MGKVRTGLAVSLDGFISGPNDDAQAPMGRGGEQAKAVAGDKDIGVGAASIVQQCIRVGLLE